MDEFVTNRLMPQLLTLKCFTFVIILSIDYIREVDIIKIQSYLSIFFKIVKFLQEYYMFFPHCTMLVHFFYASTKVLENKFHIDMYFDIIISAFL